MGSNGTVRYVNYKPAMTSMEAYDLLPRAVRDALKEGVEPYCAYHVYRQLTGYKQRHNGMTEEACVKWINDAHLSEVAKAGNPRKRTAKWSFCGMIDSPNNLSCGISYLREDNRPSGRQAPAFFAVASELCGEISSAVSDLRTRQAAIRAEATANAQPQQLTLF